MSASDGTVLGTRFMPIRCASRTSVLESAACSAMLTSSPRASRARLAQPSKRRGKYPDQLHARFRTAIRASCVLDNLANEVAVSSSNRQSLVDAREDLPLVQILLRLRGTWGFKTERTFVGCGTLVGSVSMRDHPL